MNMKLEELEYYAMEKAVEEIESLQGAIYCFTDIPLETRDKLSQQLFEVRTIVSEYTNKRFNQLLKMGCNL